MLKPNIKSLIFSLLSVVLSASLSYADGVGFNAASGRPGQINAERGFRGESQDVFVYLGEGERIVLDLQKGYTSTSSTSPQNLMVSIYSPSGLDTSYAIPHSPSTLFHYLSAPVTLGKAGIWTVRLGVFDSGKIAWRYDLNAVPGTGASYTNRIPGRVFTESLDIAQGSVNIDSISLYHVNHLGHKFQSTWYTFNGLDCNIYTNIFGAVNDSICAPHYKSVEGQLPANNCGRNYKQFFTAPAADLPQVADRWNIANSTTMTNDWLMKTLTTPMITIGDPSFENHPTPGAPAKGTFTIPITGYSEIATLLLDCNNDGDFTDSQDRSIPFLAGNDVNFNGLDGVGNAVDCGGSSGIGARVLINKESEIHFLLYDIERLGGIKVTRLNGVGAPNSTLYWDDTDLAPRSTTSDPSAAQKDGTAGVNSDVPGGVHGWSGGATSWGDYRSMDNWATIPLTDVVKNFTWVSADCTIDAVDDDYSATSVNGTNGNPNVGNVLVNDSLYGSAGVTTSNVMISLLTAATPGYAGAPTPSLDTATGIVSVPAGTPGGTYTIIYQICDVRHPSNCDNAVITLSVVTSVPTPVKLIYFRATVNQPVVLLEWATATEENSNSFEVEKTINGKQWVNIGNVLTKATGGNSNERLNYSFTDQHPSKGENIYRLKQTDLDGKYVYTPIRSVNISFGEKSINIFPNPTNGLVNVRGLSGNETITVFNTMGQQVKHENATTANGVINLQELPSGLYNIQIADENSNISTHKIIKR